ncbi:MAG: tetratricopeptide repeat protein [Spirochaetaceae bacterium]|nr:tetratricopeptide repeat protein [Spirochaetaceae bacterium]
MGESSAESVEKPEITQYDEPDFEKSSSGSVQNDEITENSSEGPDAAELLPDAALISEPDRPPDAAEGDRGAEFILPEAVPSGVPGYQAEIRRNEENYALEEGQSLQPTPSEAARQNAIPDEPEGNMPERPKIEDIQGGEPDSSLIREPIPLPIRPVPDLPAIPHGEEEGIVFSRVVRATVGQLIEIPFSGAGWVFLGELSSRRGIAYDSRRQDTEGQSFIFRAEDAGSYALKFYKQDFIRDYIINDYVQVIIGQAPEAAGAGWFNAPIDRGRVIAEPRWPLFAENEEKPHVEGDSDRLAAPAEDDSGREAADFSEQAAASGNQPPVTERGTEPDPVGGTSPAATAGSVQGQSFPRMSDDSIVPVQGASPAMRPEEQSPPIVLPPETAPDIYASRAREEFDAGRIASALSILDQFRERFPSGSDEAYWLYGQLFEANGPNRDIRTALAYYRRLIQEYPQSPRYADARRRIAYLERYYFTIQ